MKIKKISDGLFLTNSYIIIDKEKCIIIDPGFSGKKIKEEVKDLKIEYILLTHGHLDHINDVYMFNCPIYIHEKDLICFKDLSFSGYYSFNMRPNFDLSKLKVNTFSNDSEFTLNNYKLKVIQTPGHTKGSVCFLLDDILFSGDTLFKDSIGRTDLPGGSMIDIRKSILYLLNKLSNNVKIYPGHGDNTTIMYEKENNEYYLDWR